MAVDTKAIRTHLQQTLYSLETPAPHFSGKVREMFDCDDYLIMVNTDRISAFDRVLGTIPFKGALLCEQACFWFTHAQEICPHHLIDRPDAQIMVCKKAQPFAVEVIVRGYLAGSLAREDPKTRGHAYGLSLDPTLVPYQKLDSPILTPSTKAHGTDHDQPLSEAQVLASGLVESAQWEQVKAYAFALFDSASRIAESRGLLLVDTKYEFGLVNGAITLIDEVHTSDSSRFFIKEDYQKNFPKHTPTMLDKEFLRQFLIARNKNGNNDIYTDHVLPEAIRIEVAQRYWQLAELITQKDFVPAQQSAKHRVVEKVNELVKN